jgi:V8-like Glu-specific endopeptidase
MFYADDKDGVTHAHHFYGSGFVIWTSDDVSYIVTNGHVAPEDDTYDIISYKEGAKKPAQYRCEWVAAVADDDREQEGDLALLRCNYKLPSVSLSKQDPTKGADIYSWGYPNTGPLVKFGGKYTGMDGPGGNKYMYGDYMTIPGSSGSGVYLNEKIVGVSFAISNKKDQFGRNVLNPDGTVVNVPPAWIVPRKNLEVFLNRQIPKEMGVIHEKGPQPRVFASGRKPCEVADH